jgi:hypothetical protein
VRPVARWSVTPIVGVGRMIGRPIGMVADTRVREWVANPIGVGARAIGAVIRGMVLTTRDSPTNPKGSRMVIAGLMTVSRR